MSLSSLPTTGSGASRGFASVEDLCHHFLTNWKSGERQPIEMLLPKVSADDQDRLLRGLLVIELRSRRNAGEDPLAEEYVERFPGRDVLVKQVFEMVPARRGRSRPQPGAPLPSAPDAAEEPAPKQAVAERSKKVTPPAEKKAERGSPKTHPPKKESTASRREPEPEASPESDEFAALVARDKSERRAPPPVVVKKKKKEKEKPEPAERKKRRKGDAQPAIEFVIPLSMAIASFVIVLVLAIFNPAEQVWSIGWRLGFTLGMMVVSTIATTLALFVAAALLDTTYGYFHTAVLKIVAIVLTQSWIADLYSVLPVPFLWGFVAWLATFYMFVAFFDLDHLDAIRSMVIVRMAHTLMFWLAFAMLVAGAVSFGGGGGDIMPGADDADEMEGAEEGGPVPGNFAPNDKSAEARYRALTQQFGNAVFSEDYAAAYQLMSPEYQAGTAFEAFAAIHRKARADYGKPLKCEVDVGALDPAELKGPDYARFASVPAEARRAWMHAEFALEIVDGETERCYGCWLLIVESAGGLRVGGLEYALCD